MTIDEIRRSNLGLLVRQYGSVVALANAIDRSESQVSQWLNASINSGTGKPRGMRSDSCRYIERATGKPTGWMDQRQEVDASPKAASADASTFALLQAGLADKATLDSPGREHAITMLSMPASVAQGLFGTANQSGAIKIVQAAHDAMTPTIQPDDLLFVDTSVTEYRSEGIYLLVHDEQLVCKRLSRPGRDIVVSSDNTHYETWPWANRPYSTRIVGRVLQALPLTFKKFSQD